MVLDMDTGFDFIKPEFLNILFFQQKNLVIYPYVDLKHLHSLELFTVGYNVVDLESTALYNLKEIIEYEANNSYSQNPSFYFIYNIDKKKIKDIMEIENIRCILNTNENVSDLANESEFIFFNKKNKKFLNYEIKDIDLDFENYLIKSSENETILLDKIQKIKIVGTRVFTNLNQYGNLNNLSEILKEFDQKYWLKILDFVKYYFKVKIPNIKIEKLSLKKRNIDIIPSKDNLLDFSSEYDLIISCNKYIAKEFIQLLHEYRSKKVNPSNLNLEQLYNPHELYSYLRNHHWKNGISEDFISDWIKMENTRYKLNDNDINDFEKIFKELKITDDYILRLIKKNFKTNKNKGEKKENYNLNKKLEIPSIVDFEEFKNWLLKRMDDIEKLLGISK
ncbi:MAG: hypothetical protein ACTSPD_07205 [Promethearchaeota archaeon]